VLWAEPWPQFRPANQFRLEVALGSLGSYGAPMETAQRPTETISETRSYAFEDLVAGELVGHTLEEVERVLILRTLDDFEGNRTRTAVALGISVRCLRDKLRHFRDQGFAVPGPNSSQLDQKKQFA
jgi:DNA-binding NtrC family response regulator